MAFRQGLGKIVMMNQYLHPGMPGPSREVLFLRGEKQSGTWERMVCPLLLPKFVPFGEQPA